MKRFKRLAFFLGGGALLGLGYVFPPATKVGLRLIGEGQKGEGVQPADPEKTPAPEAK